METGIILSTSTPAVTEVELENFAIKIMPYHHYPSGTHKEVSYYGMLSNIPDGTHEIVESSSGNSALAAALYARRIGLPITLFLPEGAPVSTLQKLKASGVTVHLTPRSEYTQGARIRAQAYADKKPGRLMLNQARNPGNCLAHKRHAAKLSQVDCFVCCGGTYGTIRGYSEYYKEIYGAEFPIYAVELDAAPHLYNQKKGVETIWRDHTVTGLAPTVKPHHAEQAKIDFAVVISTREGEELFRESVKNRLDIGKTGAINLAVANKLGDMNAGGIIGTVTFDHADRYVQAELSGFSFEKENIVNFLESKTVRDMSLIKERLT